MISDTTHYEVIVVGAGPAGIAAATAAARSGCRVLLLDENPSPGGQIWRASAPTLPRRADRSVGEGEDGKSRALDRLKASGASLLFGCSVYDAPARGELHAICESANNPEQNSLPAKSSIAVPSFHRLNYGKLVVATGARERFLPFPGWTLPGVFGPGGLQALVKGGLDVKGKRVAVAGSGPLLLAVAAHLSGYGARIVCVAEQAPTSQLLPFAASLASHPAKILQGIRYRVALGGSPFHLGCWPVAALADESSGKLKAVRLADGKKTWDEACDVLACGFHLVPNTELASLLGCAIEDGLVKVDDEQETSIRDIYCAGEPTGIGGVDRALVQGEIAGLACAGKSTVQLQKLRAAESKFAQRLAAAFQLRPELRTLAEPNTLVCRCEDVPFAELQGRAGWTEAKLQTRCGMGPCQGRICGAAAETLFGWKQISVRPPLTPVPVAALSFSNFETASSKENP
jgi:NADPH-dependent 2,4-dienoyl-CoA reductase/sulfur reductase-like enzyme